MDITRDKMLGGMVVPDYSEDIIHCGFCGRRLVWSTREHAIQYDDKTGEKIPPEKTYGCPKYGDDGWHYFWWENTYLTLMEQFRERHKK